MSSGKISQKIKKAFPTIEKVSFQVLIEAYNQMLQVNKYDLNWEEEQFNQELVVFMKKTNLRKQYKLTIGIERKLFDENELPIAENNPKKLPRIDINIVSWSFQNNEELEYFFEAKNLYESDWNKKVASKYYNRYIDTGIENFRIKRYINGSLVGYILSGEILPVIRKLNIQLKKNRLNNKAINSLSLIEKIDYLKDFSYCYESLHSRENEEIKIKHIFLRF